MTAHFDFPPPPRAVYHGFDVQLAPGERRPITILLTAPFAPRRLIMAGFMAPVRGQFWIKRSHRPRLNRDSCIAYSRLARPRRTVVEFRDLPEGNFCREYLPASVEYIHTDPLSYIRLSEMTCDGAAQLAHGINAEWFGDASIGNSLSVPPARTGVSLVLENKGDVDVVVAGSLAGVAR